MALRIHLLPYLSTGEVEHRYRTGKEPNERTWWQILWLLAQGRTATERSAVIGHRAYWIGQIAKRYTELGPEGMSNRRHTTSYRPAPVLSAGQQEELWARFLRQRPRTSTKWSQFVLHGAGQAKSLSLIPSHDTATNPSLKEAR
jgi:hypothetical protein